MFIVLKETAAGALNANTQNNGVFKSHPTVEAATAEAERLAGIETTTAAYRVFKCVSLSRRAASPVETIPA